MCTEVCVLFRDRFLSMYLSLCMQQSNIIKINGSQTFLLGFNGSLKEVTELHGTTEGEEIITAITEVREGEERITEIT